MTKVAEGKATQIIIPSEVQGLAGLAASAKTVFESEEHKAYTAKQSSPAAQKPRDCSCQN